MKKIFNMISFYKLMSDFLIGLSLIVLLLTGVKFYILCQELLAGIYILTDPIISYPIIIGTNVFYMYMGLQLSLIFFFLGIACKFVYTRKLKSNKIFIQRKKWGEEDGIS